MHKGRLLEFQNAASQIQGPVAVRLDLQDNIEVFDCLITLGEFDIAAGALKVTIFDVFIYLREAVSKSLIRVANIP